MIDCAIIGGGPAGLNAALVLGRAKRRVLVFDNGQPRNRVTRHSHGFLTRDGVSPNELRELAWKDIRHYPSVRFEQVKIAKVKKEAEDRFLLMTEQGERFISRTLLIATGLKESLPKIKGIETFYGTSVFSCPYCDGWELRDQPLMLIAETEHAAHMVKLIYQWSNDLVVCTNGHSVLSPEDKQLFQRKGIRVKEEQIIGLEGEEGKLENVLFSDGTEIKRTGGFVPTKLAQPTDFAEALGCKLNETGGIVVDGLGRTNVAGVYAAGDTSQSGPSQLIIAAGQGVCAAAGVNTDLAMEVFEEGE
ncbi:NAD(P)/FAD-dependent oxidoreductase [Halalkalibacter oceani]|uniref:NAD(P)/FAD-dependent oxidoreductase n=1 Tax=Halalkalibacter oceani TaxID=1653776 RepID=A0A9X2DP07_9BACI|nr:NAD(P)/FAD-dependent oxidoreductase [Halalkalibacter oceani]MCM3713350.1 NAD(P)/FAD-dependent oxidoreductase [Halalkalibacter oceani]